MTNEKNILQKATPIIQASITVALSLTLIVLSKLSGFATYYQFLLAFIGIAVFCLFNLIISISHSSFVRYTVLSWWMYIALIILLLLAARFSSGVSIQQHPEFIQMLISLSIFYIVGSIAVRGIRAVMDFIDNEKR